LDDNDFGSLVSATYSKIVASSSMKMSAFLGFGSYFGLAWLKEPHTDS